MEYPFDELHVGIESQILNLPTRILDSQAVMRLRFGKNAIKNDMLFQKSKMPTERKMDLLMPTGMID